MSSPGPPLELVVALVAVERVDTGLTVERVLIGAAIQRVVATAALQPVVALLAVEGVGAVTTLDDVVALAAGEVDGDRERDRGIFGRYPNQPLAGVPGRRPAASTAALRHPRWRCRPPT